VTEEIKERAVTIDKLAMQAQEWSMEEDRPWFMTFYIDRGLIYGLFGRGADLYRAALDWDEAENLIVGELESVLTQFTPVSENPFTIMRQADGQLRFFMVAGTAVLNRVGQIDSTRLYDDMIARAHDTGFYPTLDYWHLGGVDPLFEFGQFDFLAREGVCYVGSGILNPGHPLTTAALHAVQREPGKWGASIEYYRPLERGLEYLQLGEELEVAVFTEGLNTRISLLPEAAAAAWYTSFNTEHVMRQADLEKLKQLFGEDKDGYSRFVAGLQRTNQEVADQGLIARSATETETPTETPATTPAGVVELDDTAIEAITRQAATAMTAQLSPLTEALGKITGAMEALNARLNGMDERLGAVEADESVKREVWVNDLPSQRNGVTTVTYRPRQAHAADPTQPVKADVQADKVLGTLPKVGF